MAHASARRDHQERPRRGLGAEPQRRPADAQGRGDRTGRPRRCRVPPALPAGFGQPGGADRWRRPLRRHRADSARLWRWRETGDRDRRTGREP
ncbi:hypothetical protein G6F40_017788 [Rhizopus arrhizus]|nr:hypothetical protein G6F40_017788 [Rhizopus arrhizus]